VEFIDSKLDDYVCEHTSLESDFLFELNRQTNLKILQPRMLSGHFQGRLLSMLSKMIRPKRVLEIGTYTGYSALCFLEGLQESGKIITIDLNEELEDFTKSFFEKVDVKKQIDFRIGDALEIIPKLNDKFDLVFIDADKHNYCKYYDLIFDKLNSGAYVLADNVLWSGKVLNEIENNDLDTQILIEFNKKIQADERVENILLPIRDGLMIVRKK
jgi:caffeoyl-CoA O-methyltransferase